MFVCRLRLMMENAIEWRARVCLVLCGSGTKSGAERKNEGGRGRGAIEIDAGPV